MNSLFIKKLSAIKFVPPTGYDPVVCILKVCGFLHLSYGREFGWMRNFEIPTSWTTIRRSASELQPPFLARQLGLEPRTLLLESKIIPFHYWRIRCKTGDDPAVSWLTTRCFNQLSYLHSGADGLRSRSSRFSVECNDHICHSSFFCSPDRVRSGNLHIKSMRLSPFKLRERNL